jgi:spore coat assembly protein SafA
MSSISRTNSSDSLLRQQGTNRQAEPSPARPSRPAGHERQSQFAVDEAQALRNTRQALGAAREEEIRDQLTQEQPVAPEAGVHTVVPGDTLWAIARANGVPLQQLIEANPQIQNPDLIFPGQRVNLPNAAQPSSSGAAPTPSGAEPPSGAAPAGGSAVDGAAPLEAIGVDAGLNERAQAAMRYFESQGWSKEQAAGIVSNLIYESGGQLNHRQAQFGGGPGFGLAQWEGPRQADFARVMGVDIRESTFEQQLAFIQWELTNTESAAGNALRGAGTAAEAANIFLRRFERPRDPDASQAERTRLANRLFSGESL